MTCYNCGKEILEGSRYCYRCGAAQKAVSPPPPPARPLRRSRTRKAIAGICGGFAEYFSIDISLVRIIWVLVALFQGVGVIAYIICWIVIPMEEESAGASVPAPPQSPQ